MITDAHIPGGVRAGRRRAMEQLLERYLAAGKTVAVCSAAFGTRVMRRHKSGLTLIETEPYDTGPKEAA